MKKKLLRYSLLSALLMLCGGVFAATHDDPLTETLTFNTAAGYQELTVTTPGTSGTGSAVELSKGVITVTSNLGYVKDHSFCVYKTGTMNVTLASSANAHITKIELTLAKSYPFAEPTGWTVSYTNDYVYNAAELTQATGGTVVTYTPSADDVTTLTVTNAATGKTDMRSLVVYYEANGNTPTPTVDYYVVGSMTDWTVLSTFKMEVNPDNAAEYMLTKEFAAGAELKVKDSNGAWYPDNGGNFTLTKDGTQTIYFRPQGNGEQPTWYYGYIYVDDSQATDPEPQPTVAKYYLTGSFCEWAAEDAYEMTLDQATGKYTITTDLTQGDEIKVMKVDGRASTYYPDGMGNGYIVQVTGSHTIVFNPQATGSTPADYFTVSDDEAEPQPTLADGYYLVGDFNEWTATADDMLTENAAAAGEYQITKTLTAGQGIKVIKMEGDVLTTWYPGDGIGDYIVKVTGSHAIYFRPDGQGNNDWYYGFFFVADDVPTAGSYELTSVSDNGTVKFFVGDEMVTSANENDAVTFTIEPNEGYVADEDVLVEAYVKFEDAQAPEGLRLSIIRVLEWTVTDGVYSFTMPAANARVTVTYSVDKSELAELVEDAEELLDELPADSEAAEDLQDAIDDATNVLNDPNATAEDVAEAIETLQDAIDAAEDAIAGSTIEVTVPAEGFVTMYLEDNSKLMPTREAGVKLYTVASVNVANEQAVLSSELTIVKGKTPFLLYNETSADITAKLVMTSGTPDAVTPAAEFQGTLDAKTFTTEDLANYDHYVLTGKNFYWAAEPGTIPANRCWIQLAKDAGAPAQLAIVFEGGTTGINATLSDKLNDNVIYDLSGRRVANPTSGLYIINGKKVILK